MTRNEQLLAARRGFLRAAVLELDDHTCSSALTWAARTAGAPWANTRRGQASDTQHPMWAQSHLRKLICILPEADLRVLSGWFDSGRRRAIAS